MSNSRLTWTSASNAEADRLCPGRHLAQLPIPEVAERKDATFGTEVHDALSKRGTPEGEALVEKMSIPQQNTYIACCEVEDEKVGRFFTGQPGQPVVTRHKRRWIGWQPSKSTPELWHSGESDVDYVWGERALIIDYKSLWGDTVESSSNQQLRDLACLLWNELRTSNVRIKEIGVMINQPMVTRDPSICIYSEADLGRAIAELAARVIASNTPNQKRVAGDVQCEFCRAKKVCEEYAKFSVEHLPAERPLFDVPIARWSAAQRVLFCEVAPRINSWLEQGKEHIKASLKDDPNSVPGYGLKADSNIEYVSDVQGLFERFEKLGGKLEDFMPCLGVSSEEFAGAVRKLTKLKGKELDATLKVMKSGLTKTERRSGAIYRKKGEK